MTDATTALIKALDVNFINLTMEEIRSRCWVSATFAGVRHELTFRVEGESAPAEAHRFLDTLEEAEFELDGHILADISLISRTVDLEGPLVRISLEALTFEEG